MKCISCNNEIPDTATVCPVCNSSVIPVAPVSEVNKDNMVDTSVLPTVPITPILPQDQNLNVNSENANEASSLQQVNTEVPSSMDSASGVDLNMQAPTLDVVQTQTVNPSPEVVEPMETETNNTLEASEKIQMPQLSETNTITPEYINPKGETVKLESAIPPEKKNKKTKKIIIIVLIVVILLLGILGGVFYYTQYKTASSRIEKIFNNLTKQMGSLNNEVVDKSSGSYNLDLSVSYADKTFGGKINGIYKTDLKSKALDFTLNVESLNIGEELIDVGNPLNLELYLADSRAYVLLQNFYDNYIYQEIPELASLFDALKENDINYNVITTGVKNAFLAGFKSMSNTQTIGKATINGKTKQANIISIRFTTSNANVFTNVFFRTLANNAKFISEFVKIDSSLTEEELKEQLLKSAEEKVTIDESEIVTLNIYTAMFNNELYGIKATAKVDEEIMVVELYPTVTGFGISVTKANQKLFDANIVSSKKTTSTEVESTITMDLTVFVDDQAYKIHFNLGTIRDVNPKDVSVNVKNSVDLAYLSIEDMTSIITKMSEFGTLGLYFQEYLLPYMDDSSMGEEYVEDETYACETAIQCEYSEDFTYQTCLRPDTYESIICPIN